MSSDFKDFDAAKAEVEDRWTKFQFAGEMYEVNLNVDGGEILTWMEEGSKIQAIPKLLQTFLGMDDYKRIVNSSRVPGEPKKDAGGVEWSRYEALVEWLAEELAGSGN